MEAKDAVRAAQEYFDELFEVESVLEEVVFDKGKDVWKITLGFDRPGRTSALSLMTEQLNQDRSYKVVHVNNKDGKAGSVIDRILRPAEY